MAWLHRKEQDQPLVTVMGSWLCVMGVFQKELKSSKRNWLGTSVSVQIFESILSESLWMRANCFWKLRCWQQWVRAKHVALQRFLSDRYCGIVSLVLGRWLENADVLLRSFWCFLQTQGGVGGWVQMLHAKPNHWMWASVGSISGHSPAGSLSSTLLYQQTHMVAVVAAVRLGAKEQPVGKKVDKASVLWWLLYSQDPSRSASRVTA